MIDDKNLCNDGKCKRVRMGEERHKRHIFTNAYLKKASNVQTGVSVVFIGLISLILLFHFGPDFGIEYKDK